MVEVVGVYSGVVATRIADHPALTDLVIKGVVGVTVRPHLDLRMGEDKLVQIGDVGAIGYATGPIHLMH